MNEWSIAIGIFNVTVLDIIIFGLLLIGAVLGALKGFAREASTRFGFIVAVFVALLFTQLGSNLLNETFSLSPLLSSLIAFLIFFTIAYILMLTLGTLLEKTLETIKLGWLDSILGLGLGVLEMFLVVTLIIYILDMQSIFNIYPYISNSEIYTRLIEPYAPKVIDVLKGAFNNV
jgi:membrane protein required for colicin V production